MKSVIRKSLYALAVVSVLNLSVINSAFAHCDSMDGPVITEAKNALAKGDVTPLLKWVPAADEEKIKVVFDQVIPVRNLGSQAQELADRQLFATLVEVHRASEGAPYSGIKPAGGIDPAVMAADLALENGNIDDLVARITHKFEENVRERFTTALQTKARSEESIVDGREFVKEYVQYVHYVEAVHNAVAAAGEHSH